MSDASGNASWSSVPGSMTQANTTMSATAFYASSLPDCDSAPASQFVCTTQITSVVCKDRYVTSINFGNSQTNSN